MTLRSLEIFIAVVKTGKMTSAANLLFVSQPTVSHAIIELEKEFEITLFNRLNKKLFLTKEGEVFYEYAQKILFLAEEMKESINSFSLLKKIYIGATLTVGKHLLLKLVEKFENEVENIKIMVRVENTATIEKAILESNLDFAVVEGKILSTELIYEPVISDELVLAFSPEHKFAKRECVSLEEVSKEQIVLREEGSGTRQAFEAVLRKNNLSIETKWVCHDFDTIINATIVNQGITIISKLVIEEELQNKKLITIPIENVDLTRRIALVYHKDKFINEGMKKFMDFIRKNIENKF